jgi:hypothetical protein
MIGRMWLLVKWVIAILAGYMFVFPALAVMFIVYFLACIQWVLFENTSILDDAYDYIAVPIINKTSRFLELKDS